MIKLEAKPYILENGIQNYAWGKKGKDSFITQLLGINAASDISYAELWIGAHPKLSSKIEGKNLDEMIVENPVEILGWEISEKFKSKLPFLFKVLSAAEPLSIQSHPNLEQAYGLNQKDPQNYPDANHKPEITIAIDSLKALIGIKSKEELENTINMYPALKNILGEEIHKNLLTSETDADAGRIIFERILTVSLTEISAVVQNLALKISTKNIKTPVEELFLVSREKYPANDAGLIFIFLLNYYELKAGDAVFLPAGVPHAYLEGNIIECMANSDNVIRVGLTSKFTDKKALIDVTDYQASRIDIIEENNDVEIFEYKTPAEEFQVSRINLITDKKLVFRTGKRLQVLLVTEGEISITTDKDYKFRKGDSVYIPGIIEEYVISASADSRIYKVEVPVKE